ncbi:unnamed protein product [Prunus armeniaca]
MVVLRESGGCQPIYKDADEVVTFKFFHGGKLVKNRKDSQWSYLGGEVSWFDYCEVDYMSMLELFGMAKDLGYGDGYDVSFYGEEFGTSRLIQIISDSTLLACMSMVPKSNSRVVVLYLKVVTLTSSQVGNDSSDKEYSCSENDDSSDPDFEDSDYAQSDEEIELLKNDDKWFEGYVDHSIFDNDPNAEQNDESDNGEESPTLTCPNSSQSEDDAVGEVRRKKNRMPKGEDFRPEIDMGSPSFKIGLRFATAELFRKAVRIYSINCGRELIFMHNDRNKIRAVCEEGCPFVIYASSVSGSTYLQVKTFNPTHVCSKGTKNIHATAGWLAERYSGQLRLNPNWTAASFVEQVHQDYGYRPSRATVYRARAMAVDIVEGSYSKQYEVLWEYCHELRTRNVGSTVIIKSEMEGDRPRFQRIYICLAACKKGFLDGCRPVVCLDGCHVKGPHPGQVLSAMGVDANNGMFPLAYAYVEIESNSTWLWFLELLSGDLNITNSHGYVFMTDKQKGLIDAVNALFPQAEHRHCLKHLYGNFYLEHRGLALKHQMEAIARATTVPWFHAEMTKMLQLSKPAHDWLMEKDPRHWSRAYFKTDSKCDMLMNNLCEAFNRSILDARDKPILTMLERIRLYIMLLMAGRRVLCEKWHGQVGPRIRKILEKNKAKAQWCIPKAAGQNQFEVMHHSGRTFAVDLNGHSCSCHAWDLNGIPCLHACAAISWFHGNPEDFCDAVYKKEAYLRAYQPMIMPMTSQDQWMKVNLPPLLPPKYHKQPGRPKKTRKQAVEEPKLPSNPYKLPRYGLPLKCANCGGEGHNRSGCKEPRNPNIKPTRKRNIAKDKLAVRRRDGGDQSGGQQSMQLRQRKQSSTSQGPSQSQASQVAAASLSQPSEAADAFQSQPSQTPEPAKLSRVQQRRKRMKDQQRSHFVKDPFFHP